LFSKSSGILKAVKIPELQKEPNTVSSKNNIFCSQLTHDTWPILQIYRIPKHFPNFTDREKLWTLDPRLVGLKCGLPLQQFIAITTERQLTTNYTTNEINIMHKTKECKNQL